MSKIIEGDFAGGDAPYALVVGRFNKGVEATLSAIEMVSLLRQF